MSIKRRLVLTFDAFGTLFCPKDTIGKQYAQVAETYGISGFTSDQLDVTFRHAFKKALKQHPNYGMESKMGAERWWSHVINDTFKPLWKEDTPKQLVNDLWTRFGTSEGYSLYPDVLPFFNKLRQRKRLIARDQKTTDLVVGIISNSDDRVGPILQSFGFSISPKRYSRKGSLSANLVKSDFDFLVLSYEVGFAKPDHRIFDAAKTYTALPGNRADVRNIYVHVGDDVVEDYQAAEQAGWKGVCIGGHGRDQGQRPKHDQMLFFGDLRNLEAYLWDKVLVWEKGSP